MGRREKEQSEKAERVKSKKRENMQKPQPLPAPPSPTMLQMEKGKIRSPFFAARKASAETQRCRNPAWGAAERTESGGDCEDDLCYCCCCSACSSSWRLSSSVTESWLGHPSSSATIDFLLPPSILHSCRHRSQLRFLLQFFFFPSLLLLAFSSSGFATSYYGYEATASELDSREEGMGSSGRKLGCVLGSRHVARVLEWRKRKRCAVDGGDEYEIIGRPAPSRELTPVHASLGRVDCFIFIGLHR